MLPQAQRYAGPNPSDGLLSGISGLLNQTDSHLATLARHLQTTTPHQFVPVVEAPYTSIAVSELHDQDPDYVVRVLDILAHLRMVEETRQNGMHYLRLTYQPGLSEANHTIAVAQVDSAERQMARRARIVIDKVTALESLFPSPNRDALNMQQC
jgi:hypothetical protein